MARAKASSVSRSDCKSSMRPLAMLIGIVMGSAVSMALGLAMTLAVFLMLPDQASRVDEEMWPLARTFASMLVLAAISAASFYGELRDRHWRWLAHAGLVLALAGVVWLYWPRAAA
jgi:hypothetical protein